MQPVKAEALTALQWVYAEGVLRALNVLTEHPGVLCQ